MTTRQQIALGIFVADGYDPTGAAAAVGNFSQESGVDLHSGYAAKTDHGSQGIAQWRLSRLDALADFCASEGLHSGTLAAQVKFAIFELGKDYSDLDNALRAGGDIDRLTARFCWDYERPNKAQAGLASRIKQAHAAFDEYVAANAAHSPAAQQQAEVSKARKDAATHQTNVGMGVVLAGLIGFLHTRLEIPAPMLAAMSGVLGLAILYSLYQAGKAKAVVAVAASKSAPGAAPTAEQKKQTAAPAAIDPGQPPTGSPEWIWVESLNLWLQGAHPAPPPAPAPVAAASVHMLSIAPADMDLLADKIVGKLLAPAAHK